jgi:hypothetical protein
MSIQNSAAEGKPALNGLRKAGGIAALIAGILFRRNIAAEISMISRIEAPDTVEGWFALLQKSRFLGLVELNIFDVLNYLLVGLMLLALYAVLRKADRSRMTAALISGLMGIAVYIASNTSLSMLSLSSQYSAAASQAEKDLLLSAGQSMLALLKYGTGSFVSLLLIAVSGMLTSIAMQKSRLFGKINVFAGFAAAALDLLYCLAFIFLPSVSADILSVCFIPAAGLFLMIWHILTGVRLCKMAYSQKGSVEPFLGTSAGGAE